MAKFCPNCGNGLADAAKFCAGCGTQIPAAPPPAPAKKKSKALFIALGVAALVIALIVLIAVLGKGGDPGPAPITRITTTTTAETQAPAPAASPLVGLWRIEDEDGVELITLDGNGTFSTAMHFFGSGGHINRLFGSYRMEGNQLVFYDVTDDEGEACDDMWFACNVSGETLALDDAGTYTRVEPEDRDAVLIDPFAPYPYPFENSPATPPQVTSRTTAATQPPSVGNNPLVGRWLCHYDYPMVDEVYFFNEDGTFIVASIRLSSYNMFKSVEHHKGNYKINGDTLEFTNLYRYSNDLAGWRDVPMNEIDSVRDAVNQMANEIERKIRSGTRAEVEVLLNPDHPYYNQKTNSGWKNIGLSSGDIVFLDKNHMKTNILGLFDEYERVN